MPQLLDRTSVTPLPPMLAALRRALATAPLGVTPPPTLRGWWTPDGWYVCATCAARVLARGCLLPTGSDAVWTDRAEPVGVCVLHEGSDPC